MEQPQQLLTLTEGHTAAHPALQLPLLRDTSPWRAQVATPTPSRDQTTLSSLSTPSICPWVPSTMFPNEQTSSSLLQSSACNSARRSRRVCAPPAFPDLCQHFILQPCRVFVGKRKKKKGVFKALMALKTTQRVLFTAGEVNDLPLLQNQTGHHNK